MSTFDFPDQFLYLFPPKTIVEQKMHNFYQTVIAKKDWNKKIFQPEIIKKWKIEARGNENEGSSYFNYEDTMIDWELDRLMFMANKTDGIITVTQMICQTDHMIPENLKKNLVEHAKPLESFLDWHPNSDDKVLNLLHPSMYCLINKKTYITKEKMIQRDVALEKWDGDRMIVDFDKIYLDFWDLQEVDRTVPSKWTTIVEMTEKCIFQSDWYISYMFQWLPTDFSVSKDYKVHFDSYINDLHPIEHKKLYYDLERILEKFIPMFEHVLGDALTEPRVLFHSDQINELVDNGWNDKFISGLLNYRTLMVENEGRIFFTEKFDPKTDDHRCKVTLAGRNLQVIIKLSNVELTPERSEYTGGEWHQEGTRNEDIIATGLYYYSMENITESNLDFRVAVHQPEDLGQYSGRIFGLYARDELIEPYGHIQALEDRCVVFGNYCQHQIQPFRLLDKEKKGHRKVLAFFLVNPDHERISTSRVPPQMKSWVKRVIKHDHLLGSILPMDILDHIMEYIGDSMSLEEASLNRLDFIKERSRIVQHEGHQLYERRCNLCEH